MRRMAIAVLSLISLSVVGIGVGAGVIGDRKPAPVVDLRLANRQVSPSPSPTPSPSPIPVTAAPTAPPQPRQRVAQTQVRLPAPVPPIDTIKGYAYRQLVSRNLGNHWAALDRLWQEESGWNPTNVNRRSGACGIPQFHPCNKFGTGPMHLKPATVQVDKGLDYIQSRKGYGTPTAALAHKHRYGWY